MNAKPPFIAAAPAALRAKPLSLDTFRENVVVLSRDSQVLRPERLKGARRVEVSAGGSVLLASTMIGDDGLVSPNEVGLPQPLWRRLGVAPGATVSLAPAPAPGSLSAIRRKLAGEALDKPSLAAVAQDLAAHRWSDVEIAAFLVACASLMTPEETLFLTRGMVAAGKTLNWGGRLVVDKHCIGGVPGNRTSMIVVPIVAAHGLLMPKTSSRAITSPAGTADTMEVLARVDLGEDDLRRVVETCGACIVWGGRVNLSPADDVLISVERLLAIDTAEQMTASILSKKLAAGANHVVLDIPVGPTAKIRERASGLRLKKLFEFVAANLGMTIEVLITDAPQPIGRGVGPLLEARDVMAVLYNAPDAPADLAEKAVKLAGRVLEADPQLPGGKGEARALELLRSGAALTKMEEIRQAQGPSPLAAELGPYVQEICASADGHVSAIDCLRIANIARLAGAPTDPGAGIDLLKRVGDPVRQGEPLYRIHGCERSDFAFASTAAEADSAYEVTT